MSLKEKPLCSVVCLSYKLLQKPFTAGSNSIHPIHETSCMITDPNTLSWQADQWVECDQSQIFPCICRAGLAYIYHPEFLYTLALLSVSVGLSACSPSVLTNSCTHTHQEPWPSNSRLSMMTTYHDILTYVLSFNLY